MAKMQKTEQDFNCEVCSSGPSPCSVKDCMNNTNGIMFVYKSPSVHQYRSSLSGYFEHKWTKNVIETLRSDHHLDGLMKNPEISNGTKYNRIFSHMYLRRCLGKKKKPAAKELDECIWTFWDRVERMDPKVLVFLGCDIVNRLNTFYNNIKGYRGKKKDDPDKRFTKNKVRDSNNNFVLIENPFNGKTYRGFIAQNWDYAVSNVPGWEKHYWKILNTTKLAIEYYTDHPKFKYLYDPTFRDKFTKRVIQIPRSMAELESIAKEILNFSKLPIGDQFTRPIISADTETNTLFPYARGARVIAFSFGWGMGKDMKATAFPFLHKNAQQIIPDFDIARVAELTKQIFESQKGFVFHNAKFDLKFLEHKYKWKIDTLEWDTMLGEYLNFEALGDYGLKAITKRELPMFAGYENMLKTNQEQVNIGKLDDSEVDLDAEDLDEEIETKFRVDFTPDYDPQLPEWFGECDEGIVDDGITERIHIEEFTQANGLISYEHFEIETMLFYAAIDAFITNYTFYQQIRKMKIEMHWTNLLCAAAKKHIANVDEFYDPFFLMKEVMLPSTLTLTDMEYYGMPLDRKYTLNFQKALQKKILNLEEQIRSMPEFEGHADFTKTVVLDKVLFNEPDAVDKDGKPTPGFGIKPIGEKNKLGYNAINADFWDHYIKEVKENGKVVDWISDYPILELLYKHKKAKKLASTYIDNWLKMDIFDGCIHASYSLNGTSSQRLSSFNPNLQNIPAYILGLNVKRCFKAPPGMVMNDADYSAAEVRIATWYSNCKNYADAFNNNRDFHCNTAAVMMGDEKQYPQYAGMSHEERYALAYEVNDKGQKTHELFALRQDCKRIIFGLLYGKTAFSFAQDFGITEKEAQAFMNKFLDAAPEVRDNYIQPKQAFFMQYGFITTYYKFKRRMPWGSVSFGKKMAGKRKAINIPIQGTSSNNVLMSLNAKNKELRSLGGRLLCTVHDSIVDCAPFKTILRYEHLTKKAMTDFHTTWSAKLHHALPVEFAFESEYGLGYNATKLKYEDVKAEFGDDDRDLTPAEVKKLKSML